MGTADTIGQDSKFYLHPIKPKAYFDAQLRTANTTSNDYYICKYCAHFLDEKKLYQLQGNNN